MPLCQEHLYSFGLSGGTADVGRRTGGEGGKYPINTFTTNPFVLFLDETILRFPDDSVTEKEKVEITSIELWVKTGFCDRVV